MLVFSLLFVFSLGKPVVLEDGEVWDKVCVCAKSETCSQLCSASSGGQILDVTDFYDLTTKYAASGYPENWEVYIVSKFPYLYDSKGSFRIDLSKNGLKKGIFTNTYNDELGSDLPYIWVNNQANDTVKSIVFTHCRVNSMISQLRRNDFSFQKQSILVVDSSTTKFEVGKTKVKLTKYTTVLEECIVNIEDSTIEDIDRYIGTGLVEVVSGIFGEPGQEEIGLDFIITAGKAGCNIYIDEMSEEGYKHIKLDVKDFDMNVFATVERGDRFPSTGDKSITYNVIPRRPIERNIFPMGYKTVQFYRIPAIATAKDGSLIAVVDARWAKKSDLPNNISVMVRRSPDNGVTWEEPQILTDITNPKGFGDSAIVTDRKTGRIFILINGNNGFKVSTPSNPMHLYYSASDDNGKTWSALTDFTQDIYSILCTKCDPKIVEEFYGIFMTSGSALQLRDGGLMVASVVRINTSGGSRNYALYSNDLGKNWKLGQTQATDVGNEAKVIEKNNGTIVLSARQKGNRRFVFSDDRGEHWHSLTQMTDIIEPGCDGDIIPYTSKADGYDKDRWILTTPYNKTVRVNVSVLLSYDEGKTWPVKKPLDKGFSGYTSVTVDRRGHLHILYEKNIDYSINDGMFHMPVTEFTLEWLTDGADKYTKPTQINWCICDDSNECAKCSNINSNGEVKSAELFKFNHKVFDSYIESYWEYPPLMNYQFCNEKKVGDFKIDLGIEGMNQGTFENKLEYAGGVALAELPFVDVKGKSKSKKILTFTKISVKIAFDQLVSNDVKVVNGKLYLEDTDVSKIEIGKTKIRLTKRGTKETTILDLTGALHINNTNDVEIVSGLSGVAGEEEAHAVSVIEAFGNTNIQFSGKWAKTVTEGHLVYFYSKSGSSKMSFETYYQGMLNFDIVYPPLNEPTKEPTKGPTKEPVTQEPTKEPTKVEPPTDDLAQGGGGNHDNNKSSNYQTILIVAAVIGVIFLITIICLIVVILKLKKKNGGGSDNKSESYQGTLVKSLFVS